MPLLTLMAANGAELGGTSQRSSGASYQTPQPAGRSVGTVWMLLGVARSLHLKLAHLRFARSAPSCGLGGGRNDMIGSWLAPGDVSTSVQPRRGHEPRRRSSGGPGDRRFSFRHCSASPLVRLGLRAASAVSRPPGRRSGSGRPAQPVEADARIHALAIATVLEFHRVGASRVRVSRLCTVFTASSGVVLLLVVQYSGELGAREANGDPIGLVPGTGLRRRSWAIAWVGASPGSGCDARR
jgi:hypothetical protein